ncbi:MAG: tRNA pseudouridine(55) synthase TruB [Balneolaceae bacterium]
MAKPPIPLEDLPVIDKHQASYPDKDAISGGVVIPVDKPPEMTSFGAVKYIRNLIPVRKVGHAGTLDPLATGLLILCCGKATKSVSQIQELPKTYVAEFTFGASTPSYDRATEIDGTAEWKHLDQATIAEILSNQFTGRIKQVPPIYSALWKDGKRLYKLAREGKEVEIEPRDVEILEIQLLSCELPKLEVQVTCGKGTYIRSLAFDLGKACDSLAYMSDLRRTNIGYFSVEDAWLPEEFKTWRDQNG